MSRPEASQRACRDQDLRRPDRRGAGSAIPPEELERLTTDMVAALKTVYDPEIPVDIYELGLIYKVDVDDDAQRGHRHDADRAGLPGGRRDAGLGGERGRRESPASARCKVEAGVRSALGPVAHVRRGEAAMNMF